MVVYATFPLDWYALFCKKKNCTCYVHMVYAYKGISTVHVEVRGQPWVLGLCNSRV